MLHNNLGSGVVALGCAIALFGAVSASPAAAENLNIVGTGDGMVMLKSVGEAFSKTNPGVEVLVPKSIGSGGGIKAVGKGEEKIGRVARGIKEKEKGFNLSYVPIAKIPVVFFTHKGTKIDSLTVKQVADIYSGNITNWSEVGGPDGRIRVVRREDGDSSLSVLQKQLPEFKAIELTSRSKTALSTDENLETVAGTEGTIGFGTYSSALAERFNVIALDGKAALDAGYPAFGTIALIYKEETKTPIVEKFIAFVTTQAAHAAIKAADAIPY